MASRRKAQAEQTRRDILEAALEVFWESGFVRTRLEDIAQRAGVTRGAIYFHFKDKVDVITQLAEMIDQSTDASNPALLDERAESLDDILLAIVAYIELFEHNPSVRKFYELVNYRTEWTEELDGLVARDRKQLRTVIGALEADFAHLQAKGIVDAGLHPGDIALELSALVTGLIEFWLLDPELSDIVERAPGIVGSFLTRLKPR